MGNNIPRSRRQCLASLLCYEGVRGHDRRGSTRWTLHSWLPLLPGVERLASLPPAATTRSLRLEIHSGDGFALIGRRIVLVTRRCWTRRSGFEIILDGDPTVFRPSSMGIPRGTTVAMIRPEMKWKDPKRPHRREK